ncbi:MAG TPA: hypothetical protein VFR01_02130 [Geobacterales bacterium]|nr:hypothetical protein [Geobacterales bacterium]
MECPNCHFDHPEQSTTCLRCGIIFAKYARHQEAHLATPVPATAEITDLSALQEERSELRYRIVALPMALLLAWMLANTGGGFFLRTFIGMWVHESGHAVTAWLAGFGAFPGPWFTPVSDERMTTVIVAVAIGLGFGLYHAWRSQRWFLTAGFAALLVMQLILSTRSHTKANALIIFGGDGGALILGTLLMTSFYVSRDSSIYRGALRWGFLVIGAGGFMDSFSTWWHARHDYSVIPFGENVGICLSDPTRLVDEYGWGVEAMVNRYVWLGIGCLLVLALLYALGIVQSRNKLRSTH